MHPFRRHDMWELNVWQKHCCAEEVAAAISMSAERWAVFHLYLFLSKPLYRYEPYRCCGVENVVQEIKWLTSISYSYWIWKTGELNSCRLRSLKERLIDGFVLLVFWGFFVFMFCSNDLHVYFFLLESPSWESLSQLIKLKGFHLIK